MPGPPPPPQNQMVVPLYNGAPLVAFYDTLGYCFTPYQRLWLYNGAPLIAFYDTLGMRRMYSRLKPPASSRPYVSELRSNCWWIYNQKEQGSVPFRLLGGLNKARHKVPITLLVEAKCFTKGLYNDEGSNAGPGVFFINTLLNYRHRRRFAEPLPLLSSYTRSP